MKIIIPKHKVMVGLFTKTISKKVIEVPEKRNRYKFNGRNIGKN